MPHRMSLSADAARTGHQALGLDGLSTADHSGSPPIVDIPRRYNAAHDLLARNLIAGRAGRVAYIDDGGELTYGELAARVDAMASALVRLGLGMEDRIL